jgi:hypothetical protein
MNHWSFAASIPVVILGLLIWFGSAWHRIYSTGDAADAPSRRRLAQSLVSCLSLCWDSRCFDRSLSGKSGAPEVPVAVLFDASASAEDAGYRRVQQCYEPER